ncbi:MAG TPA: hypothetical protein VN653_15770 [Anaerolineales bacterium]|nr:hypothetical protein [Anaerolineales bacterium]
MAKVTLSPHIKDIRGKVGDTVFRRSHNGKLILSKMPDMSNVKWSKAQKAHRQRFKKAVAYARAAMAEPKVRAKYEKAALEAGKRPFDLAVSDYFKGKDLLTPTPK